MIPRFSEPPTFRCFVPDQGETEEEARPVSAFTPAGAAELFHERGFGDRFDYATELDVEVIAPDGSRSTWRVEVESVPRFRAAPLPKGASR